MEIEGSSATAPEPDNWIKADLHLHTSEDPLDAVDYSARDLVDRAHRLGYGALAVTLHDAVFDDPDLQSYARDLGILLITSAELRIEGSDVVLLNITLEDAEGLETFDDLRELRRRKGDELLVIAPHPFYVLGGSIGRRIYDVIDCFDVIEYCHFHTRWFNRNKLALDVARRYRKPMLATSDAHRSKSFGRHYSWVNVPRLPSITDFFDAIREGNVRLVSPVSSFGDFVDALRYILFVHPILVLLRGKGLRHVSRGNSVLDPDCKRPVEAGRV